MDIEASFPARYWINLGRREDRRVETQIALEDAGIAAERLPAIDGRFVRHARGYDSPGRYALALTQRVALRRASLAGAEAVLILEDDVVLHPELRERLARIEIPEDWGIFHLGCAHRRRPEVVGEGLVRARYALDTHAFAVRAPYFRRVMAALDARRWHRDHPGASDWFLADLHEEIPTYACYPNLAWQAVVESDLACGRYSAYTENGGQILWPEEVVGLSGEMWGMPRWRGGSVSDGDSPRLGLLFLTRGEVNVSGAWRSWVERSGEEVRVFSHSKNAEAAERGFLRGSGIGERHATAWGEVSLVRAMMALLRAALADRTLTHFAFVSESCVPLVPWSEMRRRLVVDGRSWIEGRESGRMADEHRVRIAGVSGLPEDCWRHHPQWCLLARDAAECVTEYDLTGRFEGVFAADEHYVGTVLALRGFPEAERVRRSAVTWTRWTGDGVASFAEIDGRLAAELAGSGCFFARKFTAGARGWERMGC